MEQAKSYDTPKPITGAEPSSDEETRQGYTRPEPARNTLLQCLKSEISSPPVDTTTDVDRRFPNPEAFPSRRTEQQLDPNRYAQ